MIIIYPLLLKIVLIISVMESQLLLLYILLQSPLIKIQEVIELSMLMSQIQIILLGHFLKFQYRLYRPPVVLVHGLWMNSDNTWVITNFANSLAYYGFNYAFADYEEHNSETFDPCDKVFGNYGINSIRNTIHKILEEYHYFSIGSFTGGYNSS